jgi:hypothetical protein
MILALQVFQHDQRIKNYFPFKFVSVISLCILRAIMNHQVVDTTSSVWAT